MKNTNDFFEFAQILGQQTDFRHIVRLVANKTTLVLNADFALILLLNPDTRNTIKTIFKDGKSVEQQEFRNIHIHVGGWIVSNKTPFLSPHIQKDNRFVKGLFDHVAIAAVAGVPVVVEGIIIGALIVLYEEFSDLNEHTIHSLDHIATLSAPYLRNAQKIREYFKSNLPDSALITKYNTTGLFGKSPRFTDMLQSIEAATNCDSRILLIGKTGTGKELVAKAIHQYSSRCDYPFVAVDCGSIQSNLLESEFFGHKKGAFTGAHSDRQGLFLKANMGTLFLDEINNLPLEMQSKILRVLQEEEIRPVGSDKSIKINVRIIVASSVPLKELVEKKLFRQDLFFRLFVYPIYIPDLNERGEDIPLLANHFLNFYSKQQNKKVTAFHEIVIDFMKWKQWHGNIRELENFVERLVALTPNDVSKITIETFPADLQDDVNAFRKSHKIGAHSGSLKEQVQDFEAQLLRHTLIECQWNQSEAARRLNTSEKNIRYKMEMLNIKKPPSD
jgi:transcriptional regulator with GAF, ATPase, and Fis domain